MKPTSAGASAGPEAWRARRRAAAPAASAAPAIAARIQRPRLVPLSDIILTSPAWLRDGIVGGSHDLPGGPGHRRNRGLGRVAGQPLSRGPRARWRNAPRARRP